MQRINYKSDFEITVALTDSYGDPVAWPICNWSARFYTQSKIYQYKASRYCDTYTNCYAGSDNKMHFIFDSHHLGEGRLNMEVHLRLPDKQYHDGFRDLYLPAKQLDVELVDGIGDDAPEIVEKFVFPYVMTEFGAAVPFLFGRVQFAKFERFPGVAFYDWKLKMFFRDKKQIPPAPGSYNQVSDDHSSFGASTRMLFTCGNRIYRFTGKELIDVAVERNPDQRLCHRVPTPGAQPGLAYLDRGFISVNGFRLKKLLQIPLKGMYLDCHTQGEETSGWVYRRIPLSRLEVGSTNAEASITRDETLVINNIGYKPVVRLLLPTGYREGRYIGVKYTGSGDKIFYIGYQMTPQEKVVAPPTAKEVRSLFQADKWIYAHPSNNVRIQVWKQNRTKIGSWKTEGGKMVRNVDRQFRWRHIIHAGRLKTTMNKALFRVSVRRSGVWSDWAYFHVFRNSTKPNGVSVRVSRDRDRYNK